MKYSLLILLLAIGCKKNISYDTPSPDVNITEKKEVQEDFEGYFYINNGGYIETANDASGLLDIISSKLYYLNADNNSTAEMALSGTNLLIKNNKVTSLTTTLSTTIAQFFRGNVQTSPNYQTNLNITAGYTYVYQYIMSKTDAELLQIELKIWQKKDSDIFLVYKSTVVED